MMSDRQHGICSPVTHEFGELSSHDIELPEQGFWRDSEPAWHVDNFMIEHQASDQFSCFGEQQHQHRLFAGIASGDEYYYQATNFPTPSDEWTPNLSLDATCDKYKNRTAPTVATLYPPSPQQNSVMSTETPELQPEMETDNGFSNPISPTSPDEGPRSQKKRNRNRLAAAKCRKKAKRGVDDLQQKERDLLRENKMLNTEASLLRDEVLQLKSEILRHSDCDNDCIHRYIQRAAKRIGAQPGDDDCRIPDVAAVG